MPTQLLSAAKVAEMLHITTRTLYRFLQDGTLPEPKHSELITSAEAKQPKRERLWSQAEVDEAAAILKKERSGLRTLPSRALAVNAYVASGIDVLSSEEVCSLLHISPSRLNYLTSVACERDMGLKLKVAGRDSRNRRKFAAADVWTFVDGMLTHLLQRAKQETEVTASDPKAPADSSEKSLPVGQSEVEDQNSSGRPGPTTAEGVTASPTGKADAPESPRNEQPSSEEIVNDVVSKLMSSLPGRCIE